MNFTEFALKDSVVEGISPSIESVKERIKKVSLSLNEKPKTDPVFEIQRLLRVGGYKIKNSVYDDKGNAHVELAFKADVPEAMKYLDTLDKLPAKVKPVEGKLVITPKP
jgi:hypothetical protein